MLQLNIPEPYLNNISNVKNKYSKLFIVGFLITYMRENRTHRLDLRVSELNKLLECILTPHLLKVILKELNAENVICFDNEKYKKERVYNIRFTNEFIRNNNLRLTRVIKTIKE